MNCRVASIPVALMLIAAASAATAKPQTFPSDQKMVFKNSKGDVTFNHSLHVRTLGNESCIPCHRTSTPTKGDVKARFDERIAHYFCKGCHREKGRGPTECYECHAIKK